MSDKHNDKSIKSTRSASSGTSDEKKRGRPPKYNPARTPSLARKLALLGLTDIEMAEMLQIGERTYYEWQEKHPEFKEAVLDGKEIADAEVANALYRRATGYEHPEDKIFYDSKKGEEIVVPTTKHYPPDTSAALIWLTNRKPRFWKNKQQIDADDQPGEIMVKHVHELSRDQLMKIARRGLPAPEQDQSDSPDRAAPDPVDAELIDEDEEHNFLK